MLKRILGNHRSVITGLRVAGGFAGSLLYSFVAFLKKDPLGPSISRLKSLAFNLLQLKNHGSKCITNGSFWLKPVLRAWFSPTVANRAVEKLKTAFFTPATGVINDSKGKHFLPRLSLFNQSFWPWPTSLIKPEVQKGQGSRGTVTQPSESPASAPIPLPLSFLRAVGNRVFQKA